MAFGISDDKTTQGVIKRYPFVEDIMSNCHGSGIDFDWHAVDDSREIKLSNSFHCMNDCGMYAAVVSFDVHIPKKNIMAYQISSGEKDRYWLNKLDLLNYLADTLYWPISETVRQRDSGKPYETGIASETIYEAIGVCHKDAVV